MFYDAVKNDHGFQYDPFKAIVAPRPIGWVSTLSPDGKSNLAPYSYFNAFSQAPHYVAFGSGPRKDSMRNIEETGEFTFSLATYDLREQMNASSAHVTTDEFELAGLTKADSQIVKPPRVAESPAALECCLHRIVPLPDDDGNAHNFLIIGRVLGIHIDDRFIVEGRVDTAAMRPIARLGYSEYATVGEAWRMRRPD
ncbi:MAG: flavin reductase family protein [Hyphomicrobiales bacterium]|uniref:flavin reductase family protein n=1 Tax=Aestuariivirga sp. TaxID=2650926 RepID=UPI0035B4152B